MVETHQLINLMKKYRDDERWDCLEAIYFWARMVSRHETRRRLMSRYGSAKAYVTVMDDLKRLKVRYRLDRTEDKGFDVGTVITKAFDRFCRKQYREFLKTLESKEEKEEAERQTRKEQPVEGPFFG